LINKLKGLGDASKSDLVRATGYVSSKKDGTERLYFKAFYEALLDAKGVSLGNGSGKGRGKVVGVAASGSASGRWGPRSAGGAAAETVSAATDN